MTRGGGNPADIIQVVERLLGTEADEEEEVEFVRISPALLRALLKLAKSAKKPRGRQYITGREKVREATIILLARARKAELVEGGMPAGKATDKAAAWAADMLGRNLAVSTIKRRTQRRRQ